MWLAEDGDYKCHTHCEIIGNNLLVDVEIKDVHMFGEVVRELYEKTHIRVIDGTPMLFLGITICL